MSAPRELRSTSSRWVKRVASRALLTAAASALLFSAAADAQRPPEVEAAFAFDPASIFATTKLTPQQQTQVRDRVSRKFAELCDAHFGFFRWRPAGLPGASPAAQLTATLRDEPMPNGQDNVLVFSGLRGTTKVPLPQLSKTVVYPWFDLSKPSNPDVLAKKLEQKLEGLFTSDSFRRQTHDLFLRGIPLARTVVANAGDQRIMVPLSWDELQPSSDTVLLVKFVAAQKAGEMQLSLVRKRIGAPGSGTLQTAIKMFDCAPLTLSSLGSWNTQIPALLGGARDVLVFMQSYVPEAAPDVDGGLVTSPN